MSSYEEKVGEPRPINKEYIEIIRSDVIVDPQYIQETGIPAKIIYYDRTTRALVATPKRIGNKFQFKNPETGEICSFGTEQSIGNYYRIPGLSKTKTKSNLEA